MEATEERPELSDRREVLFAVLRLCAGFAVFVGAIALLGWACRAPLERFGRWFVERFGVVGMAAGSFLADGLHFPLPPQFYLLTGIAGGHARVASLVSVVVGSVLGGLTAFAIARHVSRLRWLERRVTTTRRLVERLVARHGLWGLAIAALLPVSYFVLCALAGLMRLPYRGYGVLALMRIPRLVLSYAVIALAWGLG